MDKAIGNPRQLTPHRLAELLRDHGVLPRGKVLSVRPGEARPGFASASWRLQVEYSDDAPPDAPEKLFLKVSKPSLAPGDSDPTHIRKEIDFYRLVAPAMDAHFVIPCYDAVRDPETGDSHILLLDVSGTHRPCADPLSDRNCELAIDVLARLHAFWWDSPRLGVDIGTYPSRGEREKDRLDAEERLGAFMAALGDRLLGSWRGIYEKTLAALPRLFNRHAEGRNLTLAHGDAHLGNFLFPMDPESGRAYLADWQFWHPTIGGTDLAFMMATGWETERRRRLEIGMLRRYHGLLLEHRIRDYLWEKCFDDYRLSVILVSLFVPVWQWSTFKWGINMEAVERSMSAFEDLGCAELLR